MTFWKRNLMRLQGRRNVTRNIPIEIFPNKFEDVEDPPSIDEDGEEVPVLQHGVFAEQYYEVIKSK